METIWTLATILLFVYGGIFCFLVVVVKQEEKEYHPPQNEGERIGKSIFPEGYTCINREGFSDHTAINNN